MANEKEDPKDELEVVGVTLDSEESADDETVAEPAKKPVEKKAAIEKTDETEEEEETEDEESGHSAESEDDGDDKGGQRLTRKQRQRAARERDKKRIRYLEIRNEQLETKFGSIETRTIQNEAVAIDHRIANLKQQIALADEVIAEGISQKNGKDVVEAQKIQAGLRDSLARLTHAKAQLAEEFQGREQPEQQKTGAVPPKVFSLAKNWVAENSWYKPGGTDKDSAAVRRIDNAMVREGYDASTQAYWDELTSRARKAIPHRFDEPEDDEDEEVPAKPVVKKKKANGGPTFTSRGREVTLKANQVHITPARKAAMIEAGVWEDPKERQRYLKSFQRYDQEHSQA